MTKRNKQRGYLLVTVVVTLFLIASIAVMLAQNSTISANTVSTEQEVSRAAYVAEAALQHALWQTQNGTCLGGAAIPATAFGFDSYTASITGAAPGNLQTLPADQDAWIRSDDVTMNNGSTLSNHVKIRNGNIERVLTRFDLSSLPANAQISSAIAWFHLKAVQSHPEGPITVHEITADWAEATVTWESFADGFRNERLGMIVAQETGDVWVAINLTGQVQAWVNGQPNFGILFDTQAEDLHTQYTAREDGSNPPRLEVVVGSGSASPVTIAANGVLTTGVTRTLSRSSVRTYQAPSGFEVSAGVGQGQDTFIRQNQEYSNYGADIELWVRDAAGGNGDSSLLKFDLQGLPGGARVLNATLSLYQFYAATPGGSIRVHRLTRDWEEGNNSGTNGNSSWRTYDFLRWWSSPGGDFDPTPIAETVISPASVGWYTWDITDLAGKWANGTNPNQGLILTSALSGTDTGFSSSDDSDNTRHPLLTITYACECGSACLVPQGSGNVLMVVGNSTWNPSAEEKTIRAYLERWGYTASLIRDSDDQASYDSKIAANDFVFVSATADSSDVATKLTNTSVGVVTAQRDLTDELGISSSAFAPVQDTIDIVDNSHYITAIFPTTPVQFKTVNTALATIGGTVALGAQELAQAGGAGSLVVLEAGATSASGGAVAGRRVLVPVGAGDASWDYLTNNGQLLVQRALQWASGNTGPVVGIPIFLSADRATTLGQLGFDEIDLAEYDPDGDSATLFFEGALTTLDSGIDALHVLANGHIILSTSDDDTLGDLSFTDGDLVEYDPATGTATLFFDESLFSEDENIISVFVTDDGNIVLSTDADATLGGLSFTDNDLVEYDLGNDFATLYFDGSTTTLSSDIDALHVLANGHIVLSTKNVDSLGGLDFDDGDLVDYNPISGTAVLYFDEGLFSNNADVISAHIGPGSGGTDLSLPIAHWKVDESSGTLATDSVGNNNGTLINGPTWVAGAVDGGLAFDGNDDYVDVSSLNPMLYDDFTISAWYKSAESSRNEDQTIFMHGDGFVDAVVFGPTDGASDTLRLAIYVGNAADSHYGTSDIVDQQWHYLVAVRSGGRIKLYVDGIEETDEVDAFAGQTVTVDGDGPYIGDYPGLAERVHGILDDIRLYDRALGTSDISELYAAGGSDADRTIFETRIASDDDDAEQVIATGWVDLISSDLELVFDVGTNPTDLVGLRFTAVNVPQGATITGAWVQFQVDETSSSAVSITLRGENADDAAAFTTSSFDISGRTPTLASVAWAPPAWNTVGETGVDQRTPNIAAVVQEIVNRPGWSPGSALVVTMTGSGTRTAESYRGDSSAAPLLRIAFNAGDGGDGGGGCDGTYRDQFDTRGWDGSNGTITWETSWEEVGETDGPTSGDIQVRNDESNYQLRTRDNDNGGEGVERDADLSGAFSATLSYDFRRQSLDKASDYTAVEVSADGAAGPWTELARHEGPNNDVSYASSSYDISAWATANTRIRFKTSSSMGGTDTVWFDNIQIDCSP